MAKKKIVVIGDWFIDENWLVAPQKLYHSSHTGDIHYAARLEDASKSVFRRCGAAEIVEILKKCLTDDKDKDENKGKYEFIGVGIWHPKDHDFMKCAFCDKQKPGKLLNPFTLTTLRGTEKKRNCQFSEKTSQIRCKSHLRLVNLIKNDEKHGKTPPDLWNKVSTNRIIRCYEGFCEGQPQLKYRYDWILSPHEDVCDYTKIGNVFKDNTVAVVIEDHDMGVMNEESAGALATAIKKINEKPKNKKSKIKVFLRTKVDKPAWLENFRSELDNTTQISLVVSDFQLARHKMRERRWFYETELGRASLKILEELKSHPTNENGTGTKKTNSRRSTPPKKKVQKPLALRAAVLLDENRVIAADDKKYFGIPEKPGEKLQLNIGRTTTFYSALIAQHIYWRNKNPNKNKNEELFQKECKIALDAAYAWTKQVAKAWDVDKGEYKPVRHNKVLEKLIEKLDVNPKSIMFNSSTHEELTENWKKSSEKCGIIKLPQKDNPDIKEKVLQLWRGEGILPGYICTDRQKRSNIQGLVASVADFSRDNNPAHPLSCLLTGAPGGGKSHLASCLAKKFDMHFMEYSIAQMATAKDFIDCLATISSVQNRSDEKLLIFIDEVNAHIEGNPIMGLLLGPLWGGSFVFEGKSYRLRPATWIFASTGSISDIVGVANSDNLDDKYQKKNKKEAEKTSDDKKRIDYNKGSDFASRLSGQIIDLDAAGTDLKIHRRKINLKEIINSVRTELINRSGGGFDHYVQIYSGQDYQDYLATADKHGTEKVYLMTKLLIDRWGPISKIEKCVLKLFSEILPANGARSLELFASHFESVRRGEIASYNVPNLLHQQALMRHVVIPPEWLELDKTETEKLKKIKDYKKRCNKLEKTKKEGFVRIETVVKSND
ncbi:MAG: AAA family ATPase [candidate division Zixibacteria bacterium]|nr:AAA family ATPase [candidate division Zixibacteria bacterium]